MKTTFSPYRLPHYNGSAPKNLVEFFLNDHLWPRSQRKIIQRPSCDWAPINPDHEHVAIESRARLGEERDFLFNSSSFALYSSRGEFPLAGNIDCDKQNFSAIFKGAITLGGVEAEIELSLDKSEYTTQETETKLVVKGVSISGPNIQPETTTVTRTHRSFKAVLTGKCSLMVHPFTVSAKLVDSSYNYFHQQFRITFFGQPFMLGPAGLKRAIFDHPPTPVVAIDFLNCSSTGEQKDLFSLFFREQQSIGNRQIKKTDLFDFVVDNISFQLDLNKGFDLYRVIAPGISYKIYSGRTNQAHRIIIGQTLIGCLPHFDGLVSFDFSGI